MSMTSRERVRKAINHEISDRVPIDLGSTGVTSLHVSAYGKLREKLDLPYRLPKAIDPLFLIAEVEEDLRQALEIDCVGVWSKSVGSIGIRNDAFKEWILPDGTPILVSKEFEYDYKDDGSIAAYPKGDKSVPPSSRLSPPGLYFDNIVRQEDLEEKTEWNARKDYQGMYTVMDEKECGELEEIAENLYNNTQCSLVGSCNGGLGDAFHIPAPWMKETRGVRSMADWLMAMYEKPEYVKELFEMQTEITLENLKLYKQAVGKKIDVLVLSGTDFAHQSGLLISNNMYRDLFMPYYKKMNKWIHYNTEWKIFMHSCGATFNMIPEFIEAGFDILNPVQLSAEGMSPDRLKEAYGKDIVFWGGGCDPQKILPYGSAEEVYKSTRNNAEILSYNGGLVGGNIHNLQYDVPIENFLAELRALKDTVPGS